MQPTSPNATEWVLGQYLSERFGITHYEPVYAGYSNFMWSPNDCITMPKLGFSVGKRDYYRWLKAGHDPGDEDRG